MTTTSPAAPLAKPLSTTTVAVVAHNLKTLGGGLGELRELLARHGVDDPMWFEVPKSSLAPARVRKAIARGAELILVWGGDGTVQRCIDAVVGAPCTLAILPAGTANLLATNLGIPHDLDRAVNIALHGANRVIDVGKVNGEHFAVMAGSGFDALMIRDADRNLKDRFGRAAYVWTGARNIKHKPVKTKIRIDGETWFKGDATCVLVGNVSDISGGITAFDQARPDDGRLDLAVVTASGAIQWTRTLARAALGHTDRSPLVHMTTAERIKVTTAKAVPYELDGGARRKTDRLTIKVVPRAVTIRVATLDLS
ncbi:MAG: Sphingosine kinaselike protein [Ilumatobacteraceae bacterium]|nr:Sphingosine kinaselike protein [Ilumatobacteraceae bacterium]